MFKINWDKKARDQIKKLDILLARRIIKKVRKMSTNPFHQNVKRLRNSSDFRLRVGDYRIIFEIIKNKTINILKVGNRKNIYDN